MKLLYLALLLIALFTASCDLFKPEDEVGKLRVKVTDRQGNVIEGANIYIVWDELMPPRKFDPPPVDVFVSTQITQEQHVRVFWGCNSDPGIVAYRVYRSDFSDGSHLQSVGNGAMISHIPGCVTYEVIDGSVTWGKVYYYYVLTYGTGYADWGLSEPAQAVLADPPPNWIPAEWDFTTVYASFSGTALLYCQFPQSGRASIRIHSDYYGADFEIMDEVVNAGAGYRFWDGRDYAGNDLPNGIYQADLYSFDALEQPVLQKSLYLLKNNSAYSNQPVAVSTSNILELSFDSFFRFDIPLMYNTPVTTTLPYFFSLHVEKEGYEPFTGTITITSMKKDYNAFIELIPE